MSKVIIMTEIVKVIDIIERIAQEPESLYFNTSDADIYVNVCGRAIMQYHDNCIGRAKIGFGDYEDLKEIYNIIKTDDFKDSDELFNLINQVINMCNFRKLYIEQFDEDDMTFYFDEASVEFDDELDDDDEPDYQINISGVKYSKGWKSAGNHISYNTDKSDFKSKREDIIQLKAQHIISEILEDWYDCNMILDDIAELFDEKGLNA